MAKQLTAEGLTVTIGDMQVFIEALEGIASGLAVLDGSACSAAAAAERVRNTGVFWIDDPKRAANGLENLRKTIERQILAVRQEQGQARAALAQRHEATG